jgi:hypothetical protein
MRQGLQPIKIYDRKCSAFLGISEEIKRDSQDIKKVELLNGMVASRD